MFHGVYRYDHLKAPTVTAGSAAVLIGAQNGLFPDMGHAVPGEMGGLWAGEKKVCDGFFFAIDDVPLCMADACETQPEGTAFHYRMQQEQMHVVRRQIVPDGVSGCILELTVENLRNAPRMVEISFTVRTEILTVAAAMGEDGQELGRDVCEYDEETQAFYARDSRNPWHAVWGADSDSRVLQYDIPHTVYGFGNTQGKGINGRLFYRLRVRAGGQAVMRLFVAGGYVSHSKAEEALCMLRRDAQMLVQKKCEHVRSLLASSAAQMPDDALTRCWGWAKLHMDWLTRTLPRGELALQIDLPEHPSLYGADWTHAVSGLLGLGGVRTVMQMLRTMVRSSENAQLAPGRVARCMTMDGRVTQVGGSRESARFVALVHRTLCWCGQIEFAQEMLPFCGLCMSMLRRSTHGFAQVPEELLCDVRDAVQGFAYILRLTGADDGEWTAVLASLPEAVRMDSLSPEATLGEAALWHGERVHVEQMIGCLSGMVDKDALPGALRMANAEPGVLLAARTAADFVWPLMNCLFGIRPDAAARVIDWQPHTPIGWNGFMLNALQIGETSFDVISERVSPSQARYTLRTRQTGWQAAILRDGVRTLLPIEGELTLVMGD